MENSFDRDKVIDCMFDPVTSKVIAELEDGEKDCPYLAQAASISEDDVQQRLAYLIETGFITQRTDDKTRFFSANSEKLTNLVTQSENFDSTINNLEKMDSYLN